MTQFKGVSYNSCNASANTRIHALRGKALNCGINDDCPSGKAIDSLQSRNRELMAQELQAGQPFCPTLKPHPLRRKNFGWRCRRDENLQIRRTENLQIRPVCRISHDKEEAAAQGTASPAAQSSTTGVVRPWSSHSTGFLKSTSWSTSHALRPTVNSIKLCLSDVDANGPDIELQHSHNSRFDKEERKTSLFKIDIQKLDMQGPYGNKQVN